MRSKILTFAVAVICCCLTPASQAAVFTPTSFEAGSLTGFTFSGEGNATVLNSLGSILPLQGSWMAMLSNGPGDRAGALDAATLTSDPFTLAPHDRVRFAVRRVTSEFSGALADPGRLDSFLIHLLPVLGGPSLPIHASDVSDAAFSPTPGAPVVAPGGDSFFDSTGWATFDVIGLSGDYRLSFTVRDAGDNSFDSAFLIDGAAIPEPASLLTCLGGALLIALARWHRQGNSAV